MCMPISPMLWVIKSGTHEETNQGEEIRSPTILIAILFFLRSLLALFINITIFIVLLHDQKLSTIVKIMEVVYNLFLHTKCITLS